jgi:hypothetical protein
MIVKLTISNIRQRLLSTISLSEEDDVMNVSTHTIRDQSIRITKQYSVLQKIMRFSFSTLVKILRKIDKKHLNFATAHSIFHLNEKFEKF